MPEKDFLKEGLTSEEAQKKLQEFGRNELKKKREFSGLKLLFSQFKSPLIYILVFAGLITLYLRDFTDSAVIFMAVFLNTVLGFYQERKAQKAMTALRSLLAPKAKVIRNGQQTEINASELVPGDLAVLTLGVLVPADGVLLEATDLSLNEAILTGESMPVGKKAIKNPKDLKFKDLKKENQVFMGTTVETGIAKMIVTKTAMETEMGKIGRRVESVEKEATPLQSQLAHLAKVIAAVVAVVTLAIFFLGQFLGYESLEMFTTSVAIAVAAIPEGLVVTLTVILALGMQRILKRKALVRRLLAAETLGAVSLICADKTGTLTEGEMKVVNVVGADQRSLTKRLLIKAAVLCNDFRDPLEIGMFNWAQNESRESKIKVETIKKDYPRLAEIPFSPDYKYIATLHRDDYTRKGNLIFFSGAPEVILKKCGFSRSEEEKWLAQFETLGQRGFRLVGFAYKKATKAKKKLKIKDINRFHWLGVLIYEDPIRKGVKSALKECRQAGIKVRVITGDYTSTAAAVLKNLGFKFDPQSQVMTGQELAQISPQEFKTKVESVVLFARTTPEQKLKIVQALKEKGEVVAMTGDGVNDAPALAKADIGIVVGDASDVAKETADMVLLDSNFNTIVAAVEEGRTIFENIKKVVLYLLSDSFTEMILIGGSMALGLPLPVTAAQILWVNLVEDALPGVALAFEPEEREVMDEPPRSRQASILDSEVKTLIFIVGLLTDLILLGLFYWLQQGFLHLHYIQTVMFIALGIDSLFIAQACRSLRKPFFRQSFFSNWFLLFSVFLGFIFLLLAVYFPPLQALLRTHSLGYQEWLFLFSLGLFNFFAIEITKWLFIIRRKKGKIRTKD